MNNNPANEIITACLAEHLRLMKTFQAHHGQQLIHSAKLLENCLRQGGKILLCGNGGSAADAQHIAAELVGRFEVERSGLAAIALTTDTSILTAVGNDYGFNRVFARQVEALGCPGDLLLAFSTSGNSGNVLAAAQTARSKEMEVIGFTGQSGGQLADLCKIYFAVDSKVTARIQEMHIFLGHLLCGILDGAWMNNG